MATSTQPNAQVYISAIRNATPENIRFKYDSAPEPPLFGDDLWHGALFVNHPTPSGCERWLLKKSDPIGHSDAKDAVKRIAQIFPGVEVRS